MTNVSNDAETITRETFTDMRDVEFDGVLFAGCSFIATNMRGVKLIDCSFEGCTLSSPKIDDAVLQASFKNSKIEGINFFTAKPALISFSFENCLIRHSSFAQLVLKKIKFLSCTFQNVDFAEADLTESDFTKSTFENCIFQNTNLTKADFRETRGYAINPQTNKLTKARFDLPEAISLLDVFDLRLEY